ncbi:hypothetical protein M3J09_006278 [Ascochyta lentis]
MIRSLTHQHVRDRKAWAILPYKSECCGKQV